MKLRRVLRLLAIPALGLLVPALALAGCQARLIYHPQPYTPHLLDQLPAAGIVRLPYATDQGAQVAYYRPPTGGGTPQRLWLACGGNGCTALAWIAALPRDADPQAGWLFVDYPSYGECQGSPTPGRIRASMAAALDAACTHLGWERATLGPRLGVLGHSLGAAVALQAGVDAHASRAVLIAPFTTMSDMVARVMARPMAWLLWHRFDNEARIDEALAQGMAVRIVHGRDDTLIPPAMGLALHARAPDRIPIRIVDGDHNGVLDSGADAIRAFVAP